MRITCPSCDAQYDVADSVVPPGRSVRCARCGGEWVPVPPPPAATPIAIPQAPVAVPAPQPVTVRPPPTVVRPILPPTAQAPAERRFPLAGPAPSPATALSAASVAPLPRFIEPEPPPRRAAAALGWLLTLAILCGACFAAYWWRADVMRAWPPSERAYRALGLVTA